MDYTHVRSEIADAIRLIVLCRHDPITGLRFVAEVLELEGYDFRNQQFQLTHLYQRSLNGSALGVHKASRPPGFGSSPGVGTLQKASLGDLGALPTRCSPQGQLHVMQPQNYLQKEKNDE